MTMFEQDSDYTLEHEFSRKLTDIGGSVEIIGVGSRPDTDVNDIIVYYRVPTVSNRGKVLITNMKENDGVTTYYFQPEPVELQGNM